MNTATIFDSETHDRENPEIVEAAGLFVKFGSPTTRDFDEVGCFAFHVRLKPSKPITLGAMSTHHITDEDVSECDPSSMFELPPCEFLIGHNIDFDWQAAGSPPELKRICTLALARAVWPDLDCHTQSAIIYHLDRANARQRLQGAHGAACDVLLCKTILDAIIAETGVTSWMELWERSEKARIPVRMPWGKHRDMPIKDLPKDYIAWCLRLEDLDPYLRISLTEKQPQRTLFCPQ